MHLFLIIYLFITPYGSTAHIDKTIQHTQELKIEKAKTSKVAHELQFNRCGK